jgi:hypothetical protein
MVRGTSNSATEALFGQPVPPELDPAQLLTELRNLRPLIDRLARLESLIVALEQISPAQVRELTVAITDARTLLKRVEDAQPQIDRLERLVVAGEHLAELESLITVLEPINLEDVTGLSKAIGDLERLRQTVGDRNALLIRLDRAESQIHRVEELLELLDQLEVLVRRQ